MFFTVRIAIVQVVNMTDTKNNANVDTIIKSFAMNNIKHNYHISILLIGLDNPREKKHYVGTIITLIFSSLF